MWDAFVFTKIFVDFVVGLDRFGFRPIFFLPEAQIH